jgi:hypothetical protein
MGRRGCLLRPMQEMGVKVPSVFNRSYFFFCSFKIVPLNTPVIGAALFG